METTGFGRWVNAFFMTLVFMISTAFVSLLYTFVVAPGLTNERPPGTFEAFLPAWFVLYELGMVAIMTYMWHQEASCDPEEQQEAMVYIAFPGLPLLLWCARDGIPGMLLGLFLMGIMIAAVYQAETAHEKVLALCRSGHTGVPT